MAPEAPAKKSGPPFEIEISPELSGKYGYKDGHVEVLIKVPSPFNMIKKELTLHVAPADVNKLWTGLGQAKSWADLPDFQRERDGA